MSMQLIKEAIKELPNDLKQPKGRIKIIAVISLVVIIIFALKIPIWKPAKKAYRRTRRTYRRARTNYRRRRTRRRP